MATIQYSDTAQSRFTALDSDRSSVIDRAIKCAEYTIPHVFRDNTATAQDDLAREYVQGFGAKLVNHLTGKFAISILPPSQPFYRLSPTPEALSVVSQDSPEAVLEIEKIIAKKEEDILRYINKSRIRTSLYPALRIAMITGDALIEKLDDKNGGYKVYNMNNYVIKRDSSGNILELIIKESLDAKSVPEELRSEVSEEDTEELELYTRVGLYEGKYYMTQELGEAEVGNEISFDKLQDKFISVRWNSVDGEDYGRGLVEEYLGSFNNLNGLMKAVSESSAILTRTIYMVNPNGMTKYKDFVEAENGDVIVGNERDITVPMSGNKSVDLQTAYGMINDLKKELAEAFLMSSAAVRDAERVTAREIQMISNELEGAFGGTHTSIAEDIQIPVVENAMKNLSIDAGKDIDVFIVAGVEALGRNAEMSKINMLMQEFGALGQLIGQEAILQSLNVDNVLTAIIANSGVASKNFLYSKKEKEQIIQSQKQEAMAQQALQGGLGQAGQNVANQMVAQ